MKRRLIVSVMMAIFISVVAFGQEDKKETRKKMENTKKDLSEVDKSIDKSKKGTARTFQEFKKEIEQKLKKIDKDIADISTRVQNMNENDRDVYVVRVKNLKEKSKDLRDRLNNYKEDEKIPEGLETFQEEFQRDMKNLDNALDEFFEDNKK